MFYWCLKEKKKERRARFYVRTFYFNVINIFLNRALDCRLIKCLITTRYDHCCS